MFTPLPDKPDHPALELELLDVWEREQTFEELRERNRGAETWLEDWAGAGLGELEAYLAKHADFIRFVEDRDPVQPAE